MDDSSYNSSDDDDLSIGSSDDSENENLLGDGGGQQRPWRNNNANGTTGGDRFSNRNNRRTTNRLLQELDNNGNNDGTTTGTGGFVSWEERQQRARSLRLFIMFLTMMLLMDDPEEQARQQRLRQQKHTSGSNQSASARSYAAQQAKKREKQRQKELLEFYGNQTLKETTAMMTDELGLLQNLVLGQHERYVALHQRNTELSQHSWSVLKMTKTTNTNKQAGGETSKNTASSNQNSEKSSGTATIPSSPDGTTNNDAASKQTKKNEDETTSKETSSSTETIIQSQLPLTTYYYYPSNATGYYRGTWSLSSWNNYEQHSSSSSSSSSLTTSDRDRRNMLVEKDHDADQDVRTFIEQQHSLTDVGGGNIDLLVLPKHCTMTDAFDNETEMSSAYKNLFVMPPVQQASSSTKNNDKRKGATIGKTDGIKSNSTKTSTKNANQTDSSSLKSAAAASTTSSTTKYHAYRPKYKCDKQSTNNNKDAASTPNTIAVPLQSSHGRMMLQLTMKPLPYISDQIKNSTSIAARVEGYIRFVEENPATLFFTSSSSSMSNQVGASSSSSLLPTNSASSTSTKDDKQNKKQQQQKFVTTPSENIMFESSSPVAGDDSGKNHKDVKNDLTSLKTFNTAIDDDFYAHQQQQPSSTTEEEKQQEEGSSSSFLRRAGVVGGNKMLHIAVKGVFFPQIGTMHLVGNTLAGRTTLVWKEEKKNQAESFTTTNFGGTSSNLIDPKIHPLQHYYDDNDGDDDDDNPMDFDDDEDDDEDDGGQDDDDGLPKDSMDQNDDDVEDSNNNDGGNQRRRKMSMLSSSHQQQDATSTNHLNKKERMERRQQQGLTSSWSWWTYSVHMIDQCVHDIERTFESIMDMIDPNRIVADYQFYLQLQQQQQQQQQQSTLMTMMKGGKSPLTDTDDFDSLIQEEQSIFSSGRNLLIDLWTSLFAQQKQDYLLPMTTSLASGHGRSTSTNSAKESYVDSTSSSNHNDDDGTRTRRNLVQTTEDEEVKFHSSPFWLSKKSNTVSTMATQTPCEFEIKLDVKPMLFIYVPGENELSSDNNASAAEGTKDAPKAEKSTPRQHGVISSFGSQSTQPLPEPQQELVPSLSGTVVSRNCHFAAHVTARAQQINWSAMTNKAINYTFIMMLVSLSQIVLLLRQLIHSQSNSIATRVSMLTIGWMCMLDAFWFVIHTLFCVWLQPLFTAFASVAFFKLLMFCVLEMKYMQMIYQARQVAAGENVTTEGMRRQLAVIQGRFYVGTLGTCLLFWALSNRWPLWMLLLHSFWVPQIIRNVVTESKRPCHIHFLVGMSITRILSPIYMFGMKDNFLREANPDFPYSPGLCYSLILWMTIQTGTLVLQSKYGARFFIPARFLPPKFDYGRPIPPSLLPPPSSSSAGTTTTTTTTTEQQNRDSSGGDGGVAGDIELGSRVSARQRRPGAEGMRHRTGSGAGHHPNASTTTTTHTTPASPSLTATSTTTMTTTASNNNNNDTGGSSLDCVICYCPIDPTDRRGYMLAPCDHIFHKHCLIQWMDVKMECPTCRSDLPPL